MSEGDFDRLFRQGGERIAPGIWRDRFGDIHWSVPELLAMVDLEDTPENRVAVEVIIASILQQEDQPVIYIESEK